jgi:hypothetical protein
MSELESTENNGAQDGILPVFACRRSSAEEALPAFELESSAFE